MIAYFMAYEIEGKKYVAVFGNIRHMKKFLRLYLGCGENVYEAGRLTVSVLKKYNVTNHTLIRVFVDGILSQNKIIEEVWNNYRNGNMSIEAIRLEAEEDLIVAKVIDKEWSKHNMHKLLNNYKKRKSGGK